MRLRQSKRCIIHILDENEKVLFMLNRPVAWNRLSQIILAIMKRRVNSTHWIRLCISWNVEICKSTSKLNPYETQIKCCVVIYKKHKKIKYFPPIWELKKTIKIKHDSIFCTDLFKPMIINIMYIIAPYEIKPWVYYYMCIIYVKNISHDNKIIVSNFLTTNWSWYVDGLRACVCVNQLHQFFSWQLLACFFICTYCVLTISHQVVINFKLTTDPIFGCSFYWGLRGIFNG